MNPLVPSETSVVQRTEIVFIESNISDYQTLLSGVIPGMEVHVLDATTDGLAQMAQILAGRTGIDAIHVISHGAQGSLQLGTNDLTAQNMASHATELATIGSVLKPGGDILLYGCSAGRGEAGAQFIGRLAQAAGADINASNDLTGAATQGGDWQLEYATGNIETTALNVANYQGVLAAPVFSQLSGTFSRVDLPGLSMGPSARIATADINGDGKADLIVKNTDTVSVLTSNGDGTFAESGQYLIGGHNITDLAVADVNSDGKSDVILAFEMIYTEFGPLSTASVLLNNGDGSFATGTDFTTSPDTRELATADLNSDGKIDLITRQDGAISVQVGNGNGTFAAPVDYSIGAGGPSFLFAKTLAAADVNGDGKVDLIASNEMSQTVSVLTNNGDGSFANSVDHAMGFSPSSVIGADVTGDGLADLIMTHNGSGAVSVRVNNGDSTFAPSVDYVTGSQAISVIAADINVDAKADLVVTNGLDNTISVLQNNGDGSFATKTDYATGAFTFGLASADFNGDGKADLITSNFGDGSVSLLLNENDSATTVFFKQTPVAVTSTLTLTDPDGDTDWNGGQLKVQITANSQAYYDVLGLPSAPQGENSIWLSPVGMIMADMTIIGSANTSSALAGDTWVLTFNSNATNALVQDVVRAVFFFNNSDTPSTLNRTVTFTAIDAGGLSASAEQVIKFGEVDQNVNHAPTFAQPVSLMFETMRDYQFVGTVEDVISANVVGDGFSDLIVGTNTGISIIGSLGKSGFTPGGTYNIGPVRRLASADINGDGKNDLIVSNAYASSISILTNDGNGNFSNQTEYSIGGVPFEISTQDINDDGKIDLVVSNMGQDAVSLLMNNGSGGFASKIDLPTNGVSMGITTANINNDNKVDLVVTNIYQNTVSVFTGIDGGNFGNKVDYATGMSPTSVASTDINNDGKTDLLVTNRGSNTVSVLMGRADGSFAEKIDFATGNEPWRIQVADVNGDNNTDLVIANMGGQSVSILTGLGDGRFAEKTDFASDQYHYPMGITTADFDGDGKLELAVANSYMSGSKVTVLFNSTALAFTERTPIQIASSITLSDPDGDADWTGGLLKVQITEGYESGDGFMLPVFTPGNNGISIDPLGVLRAGELQIGTANDYGAAWSFTFNSNATNALVQELVRAIQFINYSEAPSTHTRTVIFTATDSGMLSASAEQRIAVTAVNDAPINNIPISTQNLNNAESLVFSAANGNLISISDADAGMNPLLVTLAATHGTISLSGDATGLSFTSGDGSNDSTMTFTGSMAAANAALDGLIYKTVAGYSGSAAIQVTTSDQGGSGSGGPLSDSDTINLTVVQKSLTFSKRSFIEATANDGSITTSSIITLINDTFTGSDGDDWSTIVSNVPAGLTASLIRTDATHATLSFTGQAAAHGNMDDRLDLTVAFDDNKFVGGSASAVNGATTNNLAIYFAEPSLTTFSSRVDYTTGANAHGLLSIDVNNDGKIDLVNANYEGDTVSVLLGNGDGSFANKVEYATGSKARGLTSADVNGDGKVDLVVTNADSDSVSVLINNGNGSFAGKVDFATGDRPYGVTSADINNDGKADLIVANQWSDTISVLLGNGNGSFANKIDYTVGGEPVGVASADVNNDGMIDLIVSNRSSETVSVLINNGNGSFAAKRDIAVGRGPTGIVIADVNGDGNGDLITANLYGGPQFGGTVSVLAGLGDGNFGPMVEYKLTNYGSPYFLTVADLNGDSKLDLVLANNSRGTIAVLSNIGDGSFSKEIEYAVGIYPLNIASADFNGDGKMDVVVGHYLEWDYTDAKLSVLLNTQDNSQSPDIDGDGITNATENSAPGLGRDGISPILGDGNGDGIRDSSQNEITSVPFLATSTAVSNPGSAPASYVTLVADAQAGVVDTTDGNSAVLTQLKQLDAPADKPANIDMPLGLISFVADVGTPGVTETFSLFVDHSIPVNGYFKKNAAGDWVNIATSVVDLYSKTRIDFAITDGGEFDADGQADGIITDPGALGFQAATLSYSATAFIEAEANEGSITTSSTITLSNDTFTGVNGADWSSIVSNVPEGLIASLIRNDATHATLSFTGSAMAHANADDTSNLTVTFDSVKFTGGSAASVAGATTSNLLVDFADPPVNHAPTGTVTITGTAAQDQILTASNDLADADGPAILNVTYQWQADGSDIVGATDSTLLLDQSLVGKPITVVASYQDAFSTTESQASLATAAVTNSDDVATGTLLVTGTAAEGASLLANLSDVFDSDGSTSTNYRWQEEIASIWTDIDGASEASLSIPADQSFVGKSVRVVATSLDVLGGMTEFIGDAQTIANINDAPTGTVTITGTATQGQTLTATNDLADTDGPASLSITYQWQADGTDIIGATASTLLLDQSRVGKPITVVASYLDAFNTAESQTSLATAAVANIDDAATGSLLVTGTAAEGASLLANLSEVLDSDGSTGTSYRWQEEIASIWTDIDGATTATLSISADQSFVGKNVRVVATTLDVLGGTTEFIGNAQTIANINDAPTGSPVDILADGSEDTTYTVSAKSLLAGFVDIDEDNLSVANLTADHASVTDHGDGTWTLAPTSNFNGPVSLNYDVMDGNGGSIAATQHFVLLAVDDIAVVGSADVTVQETNAPLVINGVLSISDIDSPASFVAQPGSGGNYGTFTLGTDGAWSYKAKLAYDYLNVGDSLKDSFQVKASDGTTSSVSVTIAGTADTTTVHLGDAPTAQSGTGGQWAQAWSQTGYSLSHKSDHTNSAEAWSAVKLSGVSSQLLTGGDIYAGDLGVSGQSAATSTIRQEIDGKEALRVNLPTAADCVTLKLSRLFTNDDGTALSESGLLRLLDAAGQVVAEKAFYADSSSGAKTVTLAAASGFTSLELIAGAFDGAGSFKYGGYSTAAGDFGGAVSTDSAGKSHGSDFLVDSMDFAVTLVGVA